MNQERMRPAVNAAKALRLKVAKLVNEGRDQFSRGYWEFDELFLGEPDKALAGSINDVPSVALYLSLFVERGAERPRLTQLQP